MPVHYSELSAGPSTRRREEPPMTTDYSALTKAELQNLLAHMALPVSGTKSELIARLRDSE